MHVCMCIYTYIRIHMHTRTHTQAHTHTHTNIHTQIHTHTQTYMHMHAHAHNAHARAHTHTHTKRTAPQAVRRRSRWGEKCGFKIASCPSGVGSAFGLRPGLFFFRGPVLFFFEKKPHSTFFFTSGFPHRVSCACM